MEENKNQEQELNESNAARRLRMMGESMDEKIHSEEEEIKKGNFWDNLWYRYKWVIIIGLFLLATMIFFIATCASTEKEDIQIVYVGPVQITDAATHAGLQNAFGQILKDYDGDDKKELQIISNVILNSNQYFDEKGKPLPTDEIGRNESNLNTFNQQLMSGDLTFIMMDKGLYEESLKDIFVPLDELFADSGLVVPSEWRYDDCTVYLHKTEFGSYINGLSKLPKDTVVGVIVKTAFANDDEYANHVDFFKELILYKAPKQ